MAYRGLTAQLPVGLMGFHGARNPSQLSPAHLSYVEGVDLDGGIIRKDPGAVRLNIGEFDADVIGGINWSPAADVYHDVVFLSSGTLLRDAGSGDFATVLASGLIASVEPQPTFVVAGGETVGSTRKLFIFTAGNQVRFISGLDSFITPISTPPADWATSFPICGAYHAFRLWGAGNANDPHRVYYSTISNHGNFTGESSGHLPVYPGEGERIVAMMSFRGLLVIWKYPIGIYTIDTRDPDAAKWRSERVTLAVGGVNQQTILPIDGDVLYLDHVANIHLLSATNTLGDMNTSNLGQVADLAKFVRDNVNLARIKRACAVWYPARRQAWFWVSQKASFDPDLRLIVDKSDPQTGTRLYMSRRDTPLAAWMRPDPDFIPRPAIGEGGWVYRMDQEGRNKAGEAYDMDFETASTDFGYVDPSIAYRGKNGEFLSIISDLQTRTTLQVDVIWDDTFTETITFDIGATGAALDEFVMDTDILSSAGTKTVRRRLPGSGQRLKLRVKNAAVDEDVGISAFYVGFSLMDESDRALE